MRRAYPLLLLIAFSFGPLLAAHGQDDNAPPLGDVARQTRLAKQQRDAQTGSAATEQGKEADSPASASNDVSGQSGTASAQKTSSNGAQNAAEPSAGVTAKNAQSGKPQKKVLTNEDMGAAHIAESSASASTPASASNKGDPASSVQTDGKNPPDYWTRRILALKDTIASMKSDIDQLSASIQYSPPNCVSGCVEWNEAQQQKQQQVDTMKAQLEEQQKQLQELQEGARKQGYGSSVYDP